VYLILGYVSIITTPWHGVQVSAVDFC